MTGPLTIIREPGGMTRLFDSFAIDCGAGDGLVVRISASTMGAISLTVCEEAGARRASIHNLSVDAARTLAHELLAAATALEEATA